MSKRSFIHRTETFGLDTATPWALGALRLAFAVPRVYRPLAESWEKHYPGTLKALTRLTDMGFLAHQSSLIVDVRSGLISGRSGAPLPRYRTSASGKRLVAAAQMDLRVLTDTFPRTSKTSAVKVRKLLKAFNLDTPHSRYGLSVPHATEISGLPERSARWWVKHLCDQTYLVELETRIADIREVVPEHWRTTKVLCRQINDVLTAFPATAPGELRVEFRLGRSRFLNDVDPARIGITGATDFDHDIETQQILSSILDSPRCAITGVFNVEPRISLPAEQDGDQMLFDRDGTCSVFYQPDAELREVHGDNKVWRSVIEYERFQTRKDAWNHIERFLGWLQLMALPGEPGMLRFVVDTEMRAKSYVALIEAFADWILDHPELQPPNTIVLAVSSAKRVLGAADPLDPQNWFRIEIPMGRADTERKPVLSLQNSPYDEYFTRS